MFLFLLKTFCFLLLFYIGEQFKNCAIIAKSFPKEVQLGLLNKTSFVDICWTFVVTFVFSQVSLVYESHNALHESFLFVCVFLFWNNTDRTYYVLFRYQRDLCWLLSHVLPDISVATFVTFANNLTLFLKGENILDQPSACNSSFL